MNTTRLASLLWLAASGWFTFLFSGCASSYEGRLSAVEKAMWSTCPLANSSGLATGFIVKQRVSEAHGLDTAAVVTANHFVAKLRGQPIIIGTRKLDATGEPRMLLFQISPLSRTNDVYVRHPTQDLAAFPLDIPKELAPSLGVRTYLNESSLNRRQAPPRVGTEIFFLGYPEGIPGTTGAFPVLRSGRVASYAVGSEKANGCFLIDADIYPGDSGAPVFIMRSRGNPELAGVILQRVQLAPNTPSHFAIAVEASAVRETLKLLAEAGRETGGSRLQRAPTPPLRNAANQHRPKAGD